MIEHSDLWFVVLILIGVVFISLAISLAVNIAYGMTPIPDTYKECMNSDLPPPLCEILYPPLNRQNVNWTVPFP